GLLGEWAPKEGGNGTRNPMRRAPNPRVLAVTGLGQSAGGGLSHRLARPRSRGWLRLHQFLILVQERRILITRQEPEENAIRELEGPAPLGQGELSQPAVLGNGADFLDAILGR